MTTVGQIASLDSADLEAFITDLKDPQKCEQALKSVGAVPTQALLQELRRIEIDELRASLRSYVEHQPVPYGWP